MELPSVRSCGATILYVKGGVQLLFCDWTLDALQRRRLLTCTVEKRRKGVSGYCVHYKRWLWPSESSKVWVDVEVSRQGAGRLMRGTWRLSLLGRTAVLQNSVNTAGMQGTNKRVCTMQSACGGE